MPARALPSQTEAICSKMVVSRDQDQPRNLQKMKTSKIAISMDRETLKCLDRLVRERVFPSRSRAIQDAVQEKLRRLERTRLARECAKLNPSLEKAMAEEGLAEDLAGWPEY